MILKSFYFFVKLYYIYYYKILCEMMIKFFCSKQNTIVFHFLLKAPCEVSDL